MGAEAGTLVIMAGGEAADFERAREVLSVLGRPVHVGPAGSGQLTKLANSGQSVIVADPLLQRLASEVGRLRLALLGAGSRE